MTTGDNQGAIDGAIAALEGDGGTNIEAGLALAVDEALAAASEPTEARRILLITDAQPNIGATQPSEFEAMAAEAASQGIHLTVLGTGIGLGQAVMASMSHLRGGNAFSVIKLEDVEELMADDWPYMVSPLAYDLSLSVEADPGIAITSSYGFPGEPETDEAIALDVATVFLSKRRRRALARPHASGHRRRSV